MDRKSTFNQIKHLYSRSGFGISYANLQKLSNKSIIKVVDGVFKDAKSGNDITLIDANETKQQMLMQLGLGIKKDLSEAEKTQRKEIIRLQNEKGRNLNIEWMQRLINTEAPLREKMTLFWHGHFACRSNNPFFAQQLNNIQRKHALGNFKTLLMEVSKSPAMLQYLNNQQNRKGHPNENFARELMELFTLGRGNYTEQDIKESARAFTGWMYNRDGVFQFRPNLHDEGSKTFFGKTGNFDGEHIIDIILENPLTATFIARKVYKFFVNDTPNEDHIEELAAHFYAKKYHIEALMYKLFTSDWFYKEENMRNKIKSPVEFLVGLSRTFHVTYNKPQVLIQLQSSLGQYLFNPPNVAGWPGGKSWIDSSSLMLRLRIPSLVLNDGVIDFNGKTDPEDEAIISLRQGIKQKMVKTTINAQANWNIFFNELPTNLKPIELAQFLLQPAADAKILAIMSRSTNLKNITVELTSTPEYQLC